MHLIPDSHEYVKTLGIEWNASEDHFRLTIADLPPLERITKRILVRHRQDIRCSWVVFSCHNQSKDSPATAVGVKS